MKSFTPTHQVSTTTPCLQAITPPYIYKTNGIVPTECKNPQKTDYMDTYLTIIICIRLPTSRQGKSPLTCHSGVVHYPALLLFI